MKSAITLLLFISIATTTVAQSYRTISGGQQPQLSVDTKGVIRLVYGMKDKIYYAVSTDQGVSFSTPVLVGEIKEMHLGMTRGPQLASSKDFSMVTAIDKPGNIHSFRLDHQSGTWTKTRHVNNIDGIAKEGLMSISADASNNFFAVWLDLRDDANNKIAFSSLKGNAEWTPNKIVYRSPDKTVCECCKPSVSAKGKQVSIMFRNWVNGSRDLHLISSTDGGNTFGQAEKLGTGTWKLKGCPMDGGGVFIDKNNSVHTVWQREGVVYYDQPRQPETRVAEGRSCNIFGSGAPFLTWKEDETIFGKPLDRDKLSIGTGTAVSVVELNAGVLLAAWEKDEQIVYRKL
jgi:hypothetical protein